MTEKELKDYIDTQIETYLRKELPWLPIISDREFKVLVYFNIFAWAAICTAVTYLYLR